MKAKFIASPTSPFRDSVGLEDKSAFFPEVFCDFLWKQILSDETRPTMDPVMTLIDGVTSRGGGNGQKLEKFKGAWPV